MELARYSEKAEYLGSRLGAIWLVLNPLFLALVYFLLVTVIRGGKTNGFVTLAHILTGLFVFYLAQNCINAGAQSITSGGRLILNQAFPRTILPLSSAISAVRQFAPTIPVYIAIILVGKWLSPNTDLPGWTWSYLLLPLIWISIIITSFGMALFFATFNVYFRDTSKLLTYIMRIWLYASPVLWLPDMLSGWHRALLYINPLGPAIAGNAEIWINGHAPTTAQWWGILGWLVASLGIGGYIFTSRERNFAVQI
ncbi:MAG: ABC transporter permease [Actinomycetales bacterium]|jgi:teichoic acid transport system permease protein|nr:ABC transporter permease [Actinomycetales bacterium]